MRKEDQGIAGSEYELDILHHHSYHIMYSTHRACHLETVWCISATIRNSTQKHVTRRLPICHD